MREKLYGELTPWYRLIDPPEDHQEECDRYAAMLFDAVDPAPRTLLELGSGAGHNATWLSRRFTCTLCDIAEPMLALSRELNPQCEHVVGDMRTLRLGQRFDAVLIHDAIDYLLTEDDLTAAMRTAYAHLRPGGAAIFAPDFLKETFREHTCSEGADDGSRSVRNLTWDWDPDPRDTTYRSEMALLLRDGDQVEAVHDTHEVGLFSRDTWHRLLADVGFTVTTFRRPMDVPDPYTDEVFLARVV